jgi:hypothetical protein
MEVLMRRRAAVGSCAGSLSVSVSPGRAAVTVG